MDTSTFILIALGAVILAFVLWPFLRRTPPPRLKSQQDSFSDALETEKHYVYRSVVDLDADFRAGKIDAAEYQRLREALLKEAARLLAQLDEVQSPALAKKA